jgi:hypothetical protein
MPATRISSAKAFAMAVGLLVALAVGYGIYLAGSPGKERARKFDDQRLSDLQQISAAVDGYFEKNGRIPASMDDLGTVMTDPWYIRSTKDPLTGQPYEYLTSGATTYRLCAVFTLATEVVPGPPKAMYEPTRPYPMGGYPGGPNPVDWTHPTGRHCWDLDSENRVGQLTCGLTNPCQAGQTCAQLPSRKGTVCVPTGKECLAAACPGECLLLESYPVQIQCVPDGPR